METKLLEVVGKIPDTLQSLHKQFIHHLNSNLEDDITADQFFLLRKISECGRCNSSELSQIAHVNRSAITVMITRLVNKGYVRRIENEEDRRILWLEVTEEAQPALQKGTSIMNAIISLYLTEITTEECELFISIASKMHSALEIIEDN